MTDAVNPDHYTRFRVTFEPADLTALLPHPLASALEYILRAPYKGNEIEDLRKARWWLKKLLSTEELWVSVVLNGIQHSALALIDWNCYQYRLHAAYDALCLKAPILQVLGLHDCAHICDVGVLNLLSCVEDQIKKLEETPNQAPISIDTAMQVQEAEE